MDQIIESYKSGNYSATQQLLTTTPNVLYECKTLLKLNQFKGIIPFGTCLSKPNTEYLQQAIQKVTLLKGNEKELIQTIINFYLDKQIQQSKSEEQQFYYGLQQLEKEDYQNALTTFQSLRQLENKDDQTHKQLVTALCQIKIGQYDKATKTLEQGGINSYCYALLSECYYFLGHADQGEQWMKEAIKLNQNCFYAQYNQLKQQKNTEGLIKLVENTLQNDPTNNRLIQEIIKLYSNVTFTKEQIETEVKQWNESNSAKDQNKYNYVIVLTNILQNQLKSYCTIQKNTLSLGQSIYPELKLGNTFETMDDIIDNTFTMIKQTKYDQRMKNFIKVFAENKLTNICDISMLIALSAQRCSEKLNCTQSDCQSNAFKFQNKFLDDQIQMLAEQSQLPEFQKDSGKQAMKDSAIIMTCLQFNIKTHSSEIPLFAYIPQIPCRHEQLTKVSHPVHSQLTPFNANYNVQSDYKPNAERDRVGGDHGCCMIM